MAISGELLVKIKVEIRNLIKGKEQEEINRLEIVKSVQRKFDISLDDANQIFLLVKQENGAIGKETQNEAKSVKKEIKRTITPKKQNKSATENIDKQNEGLNITFRIEEKKLKFYGKYFKYEKDNSGLYAGEEHFKSIAEIDEYKQK